MSPDELFEPTAKQVRAYVVRDTTQDARRIKREGEKVKRFQEIADELRGGDGRWVLVRDSLRSKSGRAPASIPEAFKANDFEREIRMEWVSGVKVRRLYVRWTGGGKPSEREIVRPREIAIRRGRRKSW